MGQSAEGSCEEGCWSRIPKWRHFVSVTGDGGGHGSSEGGRVEGGMGPVQEVERGESGVSQREKERVRVDDWRRSQAEPRSHGCPIGLRGLYRQKEELSKA